MYSEQFFHESDINLLTDDGDEAGIGRSAFPDIDIARHIVEEQPLAVMIGHDSLGADNVLSETGQRFADLFFGIFVDGLDADGVKYFIRIVLDRKSVV